MKRIHINGWLRIAIVLSVGWMIARPIYLIEVVANDRAKFGGLAYEFVSGNKRLTQRRRPA